MLFNSFQDLQAIFRDDARLEYLEFVERRPGEKICAFALVTDDDVMGAGGFGDTIERRDARLAAHVPRDADELKFHQWSFAWNTGEWDSIYSAERPRTKFSRVDGGTYFREMGAFRRHWTSQTGNSEQEFKRNALRAMVNSLLDLNTEGLFGKGRQREEITLFVEITDSDDDAVVKLQSARMLNPRKSAGKLTGSLPLWWRIRVDTLGIAKYFARGNLIATKLPR